MRGLSGYTFCNWLHYISCTYVMYVNCRKRNTYSVLTSIYYINKHIWLTVIIFWESGISWMFRISEFEYYFDAVWIRSCARNQITQVSISNIPDFGAWSDIDVFFKQNILYILKLWILKLFHSLNTLSFKIGCPNLSYVSILHPVSNKLKSESLSYSFPNHPHSRYLSYILKKERSNRRSFLKQILNRFGHKLW